MNESSSGCPDPRKRKREDLDLSSTQANDRISLLPQPILQHILSFLGTKDVVRTGILSKTWYHTSTSFAFSDFCFDSLVGNPRGLLTMEDWMHTFLKFVLKSLQSQCRIYGNIPKFKLSMIPHFGHIPIIQDCIQLAIQNNVKELDISLLRDKVNFIMPKTFFSAKELIILSLSDCHLTLPYLHGVPTWPFLRKLCLRYCHVDWQIFQTLNFSCPLLESLFLIYCDELPDISLSGLTKLTEVDIHRRSGADLDIMVKLDVPSLKTFTLYNDWDWGCNVDLTACKNLTFLHWTYYSPMFSSEDLTDLIAGLPALESLELSCQLERISFSSQRLEKLQLSAGQLLETDLPDLIAGLPALKSLCLYCCELERIQFSSQQLEKLELSANKLLETDLIDLIAGLPALKSLSLHCELERIKFSSEQLEELDLSGYELLEVSIDAPSLKTFECSNKVISSDLFMGRSSPQKVTINFLYCDAFSLLKLRKFLGGFKEIKLLKLCFSGHNSLLPAELMDIPLPALPDIKHISIVSRLARVIDGYPTREDYVALLNGLLWSWSCPPESLSVKFEDYGEFMAKVFCEELAKMVKGLHCCTDDDDIKCGCRGLRSFRIKQSGGFMSCDAFLELLPTLPLEAGVHFMLEW